ncbi:unnamed protein product [Calypogeia fissa]
MDLRKFGFYESDRLIGKENYPMWVFKVEQVFRGMGLWEIVSPSPATRRRLALAQEQDRAVEEEGDPDLGVLQGAAAPALTRAQYDEKVQDCTRVFTATVTSSVLPIVKTLRTDPAALFSRLRRKFESAAIQRKIDLRNQLMNLKI